MKKQLHPPLSWRQALRRDLPLALLALLLAYALLDFPCFTGLQAYRALERRYFYGPGEILLTAQPEGAFWSRYYVARSGGLLAWGGVGRSGPLWQSDGGAMGFVFEDPDLPLVPLLLDEDFGHVLAVVSHDPRIVRVAAQAPALLDQGDGFHTWQILHTDSSRQKNGCFLLQFPAGPLDDVPMTGNWRSRQPDLVLLSGYDAEDTLIWQSPAPDWSFYGLTP